MDKKYILFEYDERKSLANQRKHGIDFEQAQALWTDEGLIEFALVSEDEPRHMVVASMLGKLWAAIITYRDDRVRIISVRRARKGEINEYHGKRT